MEPNIHPEAWGSPEALLTRRELARLCKVSTRTIDNWVAAGRLPVIRHSARCVRFCWREVLNAFRDAKRDIPG